MNGPLGFRFEPNWPSNRDQSALLWVYSHCRPVTSLCTAGDAAKNRTSVACALVEKSRAIRYCKAASLCVA